MKVTIREEGCIGCGLCVSLCPDVFAMNAEGKASVKESPVGETTEVMISDAAMNCPAGVIEVHD